MPQTQRRINTAARSLTLVPAGPVTTIPPPHLTPDMGRCFAALRQWISNLPIHYTPGGIGRAVRSIGAHGKYRYIFQPCDAGGGGQSQLLVASSHPLFREAYNGFPAGNKCLGLCASSMAAGDRGQKGPRLPCLAAQPIRQCNRLVFQFSACLRRRA